MKATLTDIGKRIGVSPSTVQRALSGRAGVGSKKRDLIRKIAEEMGYRRNLTASALKTGSRTIAVVLPEPVHNNRFYAKFLWEGALACGGKFREFNLDIAEYTYVRTSENHAETLRRVLRRHNGRLDGVLTMGDSHPAAQEVFSRLEADGVPTVFVGTDGRAGDRRCCVRTYDEMAGRMAADLLVNFTSPPEHSKVIMTGDFAIPDQFLNAQGFERHLYENNAPLEIVKLAHDPDPKVVEKRIRELLDSSPDVAAIYATSSRNTVPMCQAVADGGQRLHVIGSDIFPESIDFLRRKVLNAIIHKRPSDQAHQAMQTLINTVVMGEAAPPDTILIDPVVVMRSNLDCYGL